ncbi:MAG: hypothetical protein V1495_05390 [Pseudomonadota bacterium]
MQAPTPKEDRIRFYAQFINCPEDHLKEVLDDKCPSGGTGRIPFEKNKRITKAWLFDGLLHRVPGDMLWDQRPNAFNVKEIRELQAWMRSVLRLITGPRDYTRDVVGWSFLGEVADFPPRPRETISTEFYLVKGMVHQITATEDKVFRAKKLFSDALNNFPMALLHTCDVCNRIFVSKSRRGAMRCSNECKSKVKKDRIYAWREKNRETYNKYQNRLYAKNYSVGRKKTGV